MYGDLIPLFPYAGGKRRSVKFISKYLRRTDTYVEPFFGSGAVFCHMVNKSLASKFVINDINKNIIRIYEAIKNDAASLCEELSDLCSLFNKLSAGKKESMFFRIRDEVSENYNAAKYMLILKTRFGAMHKTDAFGNACDTSGHGILSNRVISCDREQINWWQRAIDKTDIYSCDFESMPEINDDAIVFCDPPYHASAIAYGADFSKNDQLRCLSWCERLAGRPDITVLLSNRDANGIFSKRIRRNVLIDHYEIPYSAGENVRNRESIFAWNVRA